MIFDAVAGLANSVIEGFTGHFKRRQKLKAAIVENQIILAQSRESHNQSWEMKQLDNAGWKDDVLFYFFIFTFVWAGFYPEQAKVFFENLNVLPDWYIKIWFWVVASVLGVKKLGDYVPSFIDGMKSAFGKK